MSRPTHALLPTALVFLLALAATAGEVWKKKPASAWTSEEALELLTDSPWAKPVTVWRLTGRRVQEVEPERRVFQDAPGEPASVLESSRVRTSAEVVEARYTVRWDSAQIVWEAWRRLREVAGHALAEQHLLPPTLGLDSIVVTVQAVKPAAAPAPPLLGGLGEDELRQRTRLRTSTKQAVAPQRVVTYGSGASTGLAFVFPRTENGQPILTPDTDWAEFIFEGVQDETLKAKFKLKEMRVNGQRDN